MVLGDKHASKYDVERLRIESRRKYLAERKDAKIAELEADILDDENLFQDEV